MIGEQNIGMCQDMQISSDLGLSNHNNQLMETPVFRFKAQPILGYLDKNIGGSIYLTPIHSTRLSEWCVDFLGEHIVGCLHLQLRIFPNHGVSTILDREVWLPACTLHYPKNLPTLARNSYIGPCINFPCFGVVV